MSHLGFVYLLCDATYVKARVSGRVVSRAVVVATGVAEDASREVLGISIGDHEDAAFWTDFLQSIRERGLYGAELVISDSHLGLKAAITKVFSGASWQRYRVHLMRNVFVKVPRNHQQMVATTIHTIFAQPDSGHVERQLKEVIATMKRQFGIVNDMLLDAAEDVTAFRHFQRITGRRSARRTPSSASTPRSSDAPTSSGSSPTTLRLCDSSPRCASNNTTSGASQNVAT